MLKTSGGASSASDAQNYLDGIPVPRVLLDVREMVHSARDPIAWGAGNVPVARCFMQGTVSGSQTPGTFWWNIPNLTHDTIWPPANQPYAGNTKARPTSEGHNGFQLYCQWVDMCAGFDPKGDTIGLTHVPSWQVHEIEVTFAKISASPAVSFMFANQAGNLFLSVDSPAGGTTFTKITLVGDPTAGGYAIAINPVECVAQAINIRFRITYGPTWKCEIFLNGVLVRAVSVADMRWANLNTLATGDDFNLYPQIFLAGVSGTDGAILGPYFSRATIIEVPA